MSKEKIIALLTSALIIVIVLVSYLFFANSNLKANVLENQASSDKRIEELEKKISQLDSIEPKEEVNLNEENPTQAPTQGNQNIGSPQFMSEDELLKNYFSQPPTMITAEGQSEQQNKAPADPSGPILSITPELYDLGTISKAKGPVTANFELKNSGKADLTVNYALSSCGCTLAPLKEAKILKPGESFQLPVTYDPNFYGANYELGAIEKTVTIFSNYSAQPFYRVKLKATVIP